MLIWVNVGTTERKMPTYLYISQSIPAFEYIPVSFPDFNSVSFYNRHHKFI